MNWGRLITAMVTPFNEDLKIDFGKTSYLIEHLINTGTTALVVGGTTGESPTLTTSEKIQLFKFVSEKVNGRIPVIAGTGTNNTQESIELTQDAESVGVDGIMLVTPYYNKPSQEGLYQHFKQIANATKLPVMLYNIPGRSVINMEASTTIRLSQIENIVAIKEASGDLDLATEILSKTPEDFKVYSGDDSLTLPMLSIGGYGVVSVASHIIGNDLKHMVDKFTNGEYKRAYKIHQSVSTFNKQLFAAPNPVPVKEALNRIGIDVGETRLPLVGMTNEEKDHLYFAMDLLDYSKADTTK